MRVKMLHPAIEKYVAISSPQLMARWDSLGGSRSCGQALTCVGEPLHN